MADDIWALFPLSTLNAGDLTAGSMMGEHNACKSCADRPCVATSATEAVSICRYGVGAMRIDDDRVAVGFVPTDHPSPTPRLRTRIRLEPEKRIRSSEVIGAVASARSLGAGVVSDFEARKAALLQELKSDVELQAAVAAQFRGDHTTTLNQSHDFLQLTNLVRGYAESLLHAKHPDLSPEEAAEHCPEEGAIYFATLLMRMKVDSLAYLSEVNRVHGGETTFGIHPLILKYVRIYNWQAKQKGLSIRLINECHARAQYNSDAIGAVLQGLLDNMVKYAPASSDAAIIFAEGDERVTLHFESLGPRIEDDERHQIFMTGYRGRAARGFESQGQGIGLAAVRQISDALALGASVDQSDIADNRFPGYFKTSFSFELAAAR